MLSNAVIRGCNLILFWSEVSLALDMAKLNHFTNSSFSKIEISQQIGTSLTWSNIRPSSTQDFCRNCLLLPIFDIFIERFYLDLKLIHCFPYWGRVLRQLNCFHKKIFNLDISDVIPEFLRLFSFQVEQNKIISSYEKVTHL